MYTLERQHQQNWFCVNLSTLYDTHTHTHTHTHTYTHTHIHKVLLRVLKLVAMLLTMDASISVTMVNLFINSNYKDWATSVKFHVVASMMK